METIIGIIIPFLGTTLGAACVFLVKDKLNPKVEKFLLGFAAGVMIAASCFSLIIPAFEMAEGITWIPVAIGFLLGMFFLLLLDSIIPHLHLNSDSPEGKPASLKKTTMMVFAVALHNFPEGMSVGVALAASMSGDVNMTVMGALVLAIGIAIQNFPEGAIVSLPLHSEGMGKGKAFLRGTLTGLVEPIGALITLLITSAIRPILPYVLAFAAGAMIYVVVEELIPESQSGKHTNISTIGVAIGFVLMMVLDVALG